MKKKSFLILSLILMIFGIMFSLMKCGPNNDVVQALGGGDSILKDLEPNDSFTTAQVINTGPTYYGTIATATDKDFYQLSLVGGSTYPIVLTVPTGVDYNINIYNSSQTLVSSGSASGNEFFNFTPVSSGNYYFEVFSISGSSTTNSYQLLIGLTGPQGPAGTNGISINWLGALATAPISPSLNDGYFNTTDSIAYIWNGTSWQILVQGITGATGTAGTNGISINWKGSLTSAPVSPTLNDAYYNTTNNTAYIWNGTSWQILVRGITNNYVYIPLAGTFTHASGTSWTTVPGMSATITTSGGDLLVSFQALHVATVVETWLYARIYLDGIFTGFGCAFHSTSISSSNQFTALLTGISSGTHTITIQVNSANTVNLEILSGTFNGATSIYVEEK